MLPVGRHGITRLAQTQLYHVWGPLGVAGVYGASFGSLYIWFQTARFTAKKFYWHVLMGERAWEYESDK
jgi:hypothetical protein